VMSATGLSKSCTQSKPPFCIGSMAYMYVLLVAGSHPTTKKLFQNVN
jgi:hypothetical protein